MPTDSTAAQPTPPQPTAPRKRGPAPGAGGRPRQEPTGELLEKFSINLPASVVRTLDRVAHHRGVSRSKIMLEIIRRAIPDPRGEM